IHGSIFCAANTWSAVASRGREFVRAASAAWTNDTSEADLTDVQGSFSSDATALRASCRWCDQFLDFLDDALSVAATIRPWKSRGFFCVRTHGRQRPKRL